MSSTVAFPLTLISQPIQTFAPSVTYTYDDALNDALGLRTGPGTSLFIDPSQTNNTLFLWESGCIIDGMKDCGLACSSSEEGLRALWNSPDAMFTMHNCMVYPILATAASYGWLVEKPSGLLERFNISISDMLSKNENLSFPKSPEPWKAVNTCIKTMCNLLYGTRANENNCTMDGWGYKTSYTFGAQRPLWSPTMTGRLDFCSMGSNLPNPDLGGPGILISCIQQVAILMAMWILLSLLPFLRRILRVLRGRLIASADNRPKAHDKPGRQIVALVVALQEFQKVQVFFCLALQVAFIIALNNATFLDGFTIKRLWDTMGVIAVLSVSGVYSIIIGLLILRKSKGHLEWFILAVSLICIVISSAIWYTSMHVKISQLRQSDFNPPECGGINPMQYCLSSADEKLKEAVTEKFSVFYQWTSAGPLFVALALAMERVFPITTWPLPAFISKAIKWTLISIALFFAEVWLLWGNVSMLIGLVYVWINKDIVEMVWTLGQVISAGIFIPVFLEWLYIAIWGVESGISIRLPPGYEVVPAKTHIISPHPADTSQANVALDENRSSNVTLSTYELLPSPYEGDHRVARANAWSPA